MNIQDINLAIIQSQISKFTQTHSNEIYLFYQVFFVERRAQNPLLLHRSSA